MDEALRLSDYLPVYLKPSDEQAYIPLLWTSFESNYSSKNYQFAFLAYHLLMMTLVYSKIWQIRQTCPIDFDKGLIGFSKDHEDHLKDASPFTFSRVRESDALGLFRLIGCDNSQIGNYRALVRDRNSIAHANGKIELGTQREADRKIRQVLRAVEEIQAHSQPVVRRYYKEFLLQSYDPEEREFADAEDQIREILIRGNYMSHKDIEICANFDISTLDSDNRAAIGSLHNTLRETYDF